MTVPRGARTLSRVWNVLRAPGSPPPGVASFTTLLGAGTVLFVAVLIALGIRDHDRAAWHFYEARVGTYASAALLVTSAALAGWVARRLAGRALARFWLVAAGGFLYLAWDELAVVHEGIDKWVHRRLGWPSDHPVTTHLDAVIVMAYGAGALAWGFRYREALLRLRWATLLLVVAFAGFAAMAVLDVTGISAAAEESLKLITEAMIVAGVYAAGRDPALAELA